MPISTRARVRRGEPQRETGRGFNVDRFKDNVRKWWVKVDQLKKTDVSGSPELIKQKNALLTRADLIKRTIQKVPGLDDLGLGDLAAIQFVPIAIAGVVTSGIGLWTTNFYKFMRTYDAYEELINKGHSPQEAVEVATKLRKGASPSLFSFPNIAKIIVPVAIIGVGYYFFKTKMRK